MAFTIDASSRFFCAWKKMSLCMEIYKELRYNFDEEKSKQILESVEVLVMDEKDKKSRISNMINNLLDSVANELESLGTEAINVIFQDVKEWGINKYNQFKSDSNNDAQAKLQELERSIEIFNENVEIGMKREELAVMWAMEKLGYSTEEIQQVINLANGTSPAED